MGVTGQQYEKVRVLFNKILDIKKKYGHEAKEVFQWIYRIAKVMGSVSTPTSVWTLRAQLPPTV